MKETFIKYLLEQGVSIDEAEDEWKLLEEEYNEWWKELEGQE